MSTKLLNSHLLSSVFQKVQQDLLSGVYIFGTYENKYDVIRVWTRFRDITFAVVASSSKRFGSNFSSIEIQAFTENGGMKLFVLHKDTVGLHEGTQYESQIVKLSRTYQPLDDEDVSTEESSNFIKSYLSSQPDKSLTIESFQKSFYNKKQYKWVTPELYKKFS
jgi:hypothetical protein